MKILQVISYFNPKFGGDVNVVYNLSKNLSKKGHKITILTTDYGFDNKYANTINNDGVEVIPFHCNLNWGFFLYTPALKSWIKENIKQFDIIHMHNFRSYQNNVIYKYAKKYNVRYILQAHGSVLPFFTKQILKKIYDLIWGYRILMNLSNAIALTQEELDQYKKMGVAQNKILIIPNGIDLSLFYQLPKKGTFRDKYKIPSYTKIVLYLGRLHKIKGIDLLIDVFSQVKKKIPMSKLIIVGPDEGFLQILQKKVEVLNISHDVIFTGPLYGEEKFAAYVDANVYVLPSVYDAFPNTVLEAWVASTPVIVTKGCCFSDFVEKAGYSVNYDKEEMKRSIENILLNETLKLKLGEKGKKLLAEKFDLSIVVEKIEKLYKDCNKI